MNIPFIPIQGPENKIQDQTIRQGNIYFTTDTGKILLDTADERIVLGTSGAAVFYSNSDGLVANTDDSFTIPYQDLDDQHAIPKKDDLIINSDGRFFRVNYFYSHETNPFVNCKLIAVSGTGGGGGGEGGGTTDPEDPKVIDVVYEDLKYSFLYGTNYNIVLTATSKVDNYLNISYVVNNANGKTVDLGTVSARSGQKVTLPVGKNIAPDGTYHGVTITINGVNSIQYSKTINRIKCIDLKVENDNENFTSQQIYDKSVSYYVKVYGQIAKTLHIEIDGKEIIDPIISPETESNISKYVGINCANLKLAAGIHTITAYLVADGVESNKVHTDFIYHPQDAEDATYVIVTKYPEACLSYELPEIEYWVYDTSKPEGVTNTIIPSINGVSLDAVYFPQQEGKALIWHVSGLVPNQDNICALSCNGTTREVTIYCEYSNIFDHIVDDAVVLLGTEGRSNNTSLERRLQWEYTNDKNETLKANLIDFNWKNNGWYTDDAGRNCLRISNGAKVEIPFSLFTNEIPTSGGFTFDIEFKPYNLYSYNLLTQSTKTVESEGDGGDEEVEVQRAYNADLASISYIAGSGTEAYGFCCGTQDAFFRMSNGDSAAVRYMDNEIVNISVTINAARKQICMYVNGIMSGMVAYKNSARLPIYANKLILNSEHCDLDVYNIRVYNKALTSSEITQNFIASKKDMQIYKENNFSTGDKVNLNELISYNNDNPDNATIPYMIFKTTKAPDLLPYNKANDDVICDIKFVNPGLDYALALGIIDEAYYKTHAPSFSATGVSLNVQGTSSQKYPRKNFKGKFKNATSWECINEAITDKSLSKFSIREGMAEKTFTWKVDYMDSSSCHNTGFASYVYDLYKNHPLDYYENTDVALTGSEVGTYHKKYRTSLFGFPVLAFHETSYGTTEFIGIYNFNLDKGADDTLGMAVDKDHPYADGTYEEICECWEMANNMGGRCSFRGNPFDYGYDYEKKKFIAFKDGVEIEGTTDLGEDLEVRYHINGDAIEGAWENRNLPADKKGSQYIGSEAAFEVLLGGNADGTGRTGAYAHLEKFFKWIQSCFYAFDLNNSEDQTWVQELLGRNEEIKAIDADYITLVAERKAKFENEFNDHLNMEYCMVYYIMTELLLQFDSRGKNMMFSSWGPMKEGGDYIWFPIYYDVDTQLGVNNSGIPSWEYNVEPSTGFNNAGGARAFSTANSLLWLNFHASYVEDKPNDIRSAYRRLRANNLTIPKLNGYYNFDYEISKDYCMKGILPINIFNANQSYKYIQPSITGYVNGINDDGTPEMRVTSAYFYCLQGTRELHRALFLRNRFNYYDSKWMAGSYQPGFTNTDQFWRVNAHKNDKDSSLNSNLLFNIKPSLDQYLVIWLDDKEPEPIFAKGGEITQVDLSTLMTNADTYTQQIVHIGGPKYIQEYGDVSLLYVDEFEYKAPAVTKITMGNENPNYSPDPNFKTDALPEATTDKPLLKVFDITNIRNIAVEISSVDLTDSVKLEEFRALGTSLTEVDFADGVNLQKVYLPEGLQRLTLKNAMALNKIVYSEDEIYETVDGKRKQNKPVMYLAKVIKDDGSTNIGIINIVSGGLKQHSYKLLEKITEARQTMIDKNNDTKLQITMEEVHWTPFTQLGDGAKYVSEDAANYYYATNNASFETYNYTNEDTWQLDILSGRIYHYDESDVEMASTLTLLDTYINDEKAHFTNVSTMIDKEYPAITGSMYVENTENTKISEADLFNKYAIYFPDLDIRAKFIEDAYRARFVSYINNVEKELHIQRVSKTANKTFVSPPEAHTIPAPSHYVFKGWSLHKPTGNYNDDVSSIIPDSELEKYYFSGVETEYSKAEFTFYAVYNREAYTITFADTTTVPGETNVYSYSYESLWGDSLTEPPLIPWREYEESLLNIDERLTFYGWTNMEASSGIVNNEAAAQSIILNIESIKADRNYTFYPVYVRENVYSKPTDFKYFNLDMIKTINGVTGIQIQTKSAYELRGKITIPASYNNYPIIAIGNFTQAVRATHIFFEENPFFLEVSDYAFAGAADMLQSDLKLKGVFLPPSTITIGAHAFNGMTGLEHISEKYVTEGIVGHIGDNITTIGNRAFYHTGTLRVANLPPRLTVVSQSAFENAGPNVTLSNLPDAVTRIEMSAFMGCPNVQITNFGKKSNEVGASSALNYIGSYAFANGGNTTGAHASVHNIFIWDSVIKMESPAFISYGSNVTIYTSHEKAPTGWTNVNDSEADGGGSAMGVAQIVYGYTGEV